MYGAFRLPPQIGFRFQAIQSLQLPKTTKGRRDRTSDPSKQQLRGTKAKSHPHPEAPMKSRLKAATEEANTTDVEIVSGNTRANAEICSVIENAVKAAVAQLAKSIADEAREERIAAAAQLDAKVQQAVETAVAKLPSPQRKKSKKKN